MKHHRPPRFAPTHAHDCDSCRGKVRIRLVAPIGYVPHGSVHPVKQFKNQFERAGFQFEAPTISQNICCIFWQNSNPLWGSFVPQTLSKGLFFRTAGEANTYRTDPGSVRCTQGGSSTMYKVHQGPCCPHYLAHKQCLKQLQVRLVSTGRQHVRDWASTRPHAVPWNWQ